MALEYTIKANHSENRVYVTIKGSITMQNVDEYDAAFMGEVRKLKPGFTVLFDIRESTAWEPEAAKKMEPNVKTCISLGMKKFAWVVNSVVLKGQMKRNYDTQSGGIDGNFISVEDAIKFLDS